MCLLKMWATCYEQVKAAELFAVFSEMQVIVSLLHRDGLAKVQEEDKHFLP